MTSTLALKAVLAAVLTTSLVFVHGVSAQLNHTTLPACCFDPFGNYNEAFEGTLRTNMSVICTNCGPELTALGQFLGLVVVNTDGTQGNTQGVLVLSCTNCSALTTLGSFTALQYITNGGVSLSCTNCPALTTLGTLAVLEYVSLSGATTLTLSCTNCAALTTLGTFSAMQSVGDNVGTGALAISCTNCAALTTFGTFANLRTVGYYYGGGSLVLSCSNCVALTTLGTFVALQSVGNDQPGSLTLSCNNCASLTTLGEFAVLQNIGNAGPGTLTISCTDCAALVTLGSFTALQYLSFNDGTTTFALSCINCASLTTLGLFVALRYGSDSGTSVLTLTCTNCSHMTTLGTFPALQSIANSNSMGTLGLTCTNCAALTSLGSLPMLIMSFQGTLSVSCSSCPMLPALAQTPSSQNFSGSAVNGLCTGNFTICTSTSTSLPCVVKPSLQPECPLCTAIDSPLYCPMAGCCTDVNRNYNEAIAGYLLVDMHAYCTNCGPDLTTLGNFTALSYVGSYRGTGTLTITCTNCSALTILGSFMTLQYVGFDAGTGTLTLSCTDCASLTTLGTFVVLQNVGSSATGTLVLSCDNCSHLTTLGSFSSLSTVVLNQGTSLGTGTLSVSCLNCPMLSMMSQFPVLEYITSTIAGPANGALVFVCNDCAELPIFANFPSLQNIFNGVASTASLSFFCTDCPSFSSVTSASFSLLPSSSNQLNLITATCNGCAPIFNASFPIVYAFTGSLPQYFEVFSDGAGLSVFNATTVPNSFLESLSSVNRFTSLSFDNVNLQTMDAFVGLERVDNGLVVQSCDNLTNIDGLTVNLQTVSYVTIMNNPLLCNIDIARLEVVTQSNPIITDNRPLSSCTSLLPTTPSQLDAVTVSSSMVQLSWSSVAQPSVAVVYTLVMNDVVILTYPSYNPPLLPYSITSLAQQTSYTFVLSATLKGITRPSAPLIVKTPGGPATSCPAGYIGTIISNCTICTAGTFASSDGRTCVACVAGTYSNVSALASSAGCTLCGPKSVASNPGLASCTTCSPSQLCPYGAAAPLSTSVQFSSVPAASMISTMATGDSTVGFQIGYIFIIVFFGAAFALGLFVLVFRKQMRMTVSRFAAVMRTPRWLLRVDNSSSQLMEKPSLARGLIGIWVLLGLVLVTAYQIYNFVENQYGTLTTLQPGTTFSNGQSIASASTQLSVTMVFLASPISCTNIFDASLGPTPLNTIGCQISSDGVNTTLAFGTAPNTQLALSQGSVVDMTLTITTANGNVVFTPMLQYAIVMQQFDGSAITINETLVGTNTAVLTGPTVISLAGVAAEKVDIDDSVTSTGYTFSYISTTPHFASQPSTSLTLTFEISVPSYFLKAQQVQAISALTFVSGLLAIGGGVFAAGTTFAFLYSYISHHFFGHHHHDHTSGFELSSEHKTSSSLGAL